MTARTALLLLLAMMIPIGLFDRAVVADEDASTPIRFHRALAPENRIKDWPLGDVGGEKYLPIDAEEFDGLVAAAQSRQSPPAVAISSAFYEARLEGDLLIGRASIDVELIGQAPAVLPWEPCSLAMREVAWKTAEGGGRRAEGGAIALTPDPSPVLGEGRNSSPALFGLGGDGKLQAVVERSGRLRFDWSLAGRRDSADVLGFLGEIPSATASLWRIDLPDGLTPVVDRGVVVGSEPAGENMRRWHIEFGGNHRFRMRLVTAETSDPHPQLALLRESRTCEVSPRGVEVSAQWRLQVYNKPLSHIAVLLDPGLHLVSARVGDSLLSWTVSPPPTDGQGTRVVLALPEPIRDAEQVVRLGAIGQAVLDRPWRLPRIRAEGVFWQEGNIAVLVPELLAIDRITPSGCGQTSTGLLSAPRVGESMQFQAFDPDATVEVLLSRHPAASPTASNAKQPSNNISPLPLGEGQGVRAARADETRSCSWTAAKKTTLPATSEKRKAVSNRNTDPERIASAESVAWAWRCELESRYQADGAALHRATYDLQSSGHGRIHLALPAEVVRKNIRGAWIDEKPARWQWRQSETANGLTIELPASQKYPRLVIQWTASGSSLGIVGALTPPLPEPDLPVFACHWTVWLPPAYAPMARPASLPSETEDAADSQGWSMMSMDLDTGSSTRLHYVHGVTMRLTGVVAFMLAVALGCWKAVDRPVYLAALSGGLVLIAMLLPEAFRPPALGGALGMIFCMAWGWIRHRTTPPLAALQSFGNPAPDASLGSTVTKAVRIGLMLLAATTLLVDGLASAETPMYRVWTPIDAENKPIGDKVYVPEALYRELHRRAAPTDGPQGWLIDRATYQGALAANAEGDRWRIDALRAQYDLKVFGRFTQVRIPLRDEDVSLAPDSVMLDGRVIQTEWVREKGVRSNLGEAPEGPFRQIGPDPFFPPATNTLKFEVAEPGEYRLEMMLRPSVRNGGGKVRSGLFDWHAIQRMAQQWVGPYRTDHPQPPDANKPVDSFTVLDVSIPRVAVTRFELTLPEDAPSIDVPSAHGQVRVEKNRPRLVADVGPADRLTVRWRESTSLSEAEPIVDADQLVWLKIQPGSLVMTAKFQLHVAEGQIRQVQLAVDPRLRLLPMAGDDPPTVQIGQESGQSRLVTFRWPHPIADTVTLETAFLLSGATGVGNFRPPRIELLGARNIQHWMAVSVASTLDYEERNVQGLVPVKGDDFLRAWKGEEGRGKAEGGGRRAENSPSTIRHPPSDLPDPLPIPQFAYRLPDGAIDWSISTRSHESRSETDQTLLIGCDRDRIDLRFEALVSTTSGYLFQHRLSAPKDWKIEKVSLLEGNVERAGRWSRDDNGIVTVFLTSAVSGSQRLLLRGSMPIPSDKAWPLPRIRLEQCQRHSSTIHLYQQPGVRATINGERPKSETESTHDTSAERNLGQWIATFPENESQSVSITVAAQPDRAKSPSPPMMDSPDPKVITKPSAESTSRPENSGIVSSADVVVAWRADGVCYGTASFEVEPRDAIECPLHLPDGYALVHASVEGEIAALAKVGDSAWRISLVSRRRTQRVEVVFRGVLPEIGQSNRCAFQSPTLGQWPVRQTFWTVIGPSSWIDATREEDDRASSHNVPASLFPASQPTMRSSFEGRADSWTLDCRLVDPDGSSRRLIVFVGLTALATLAVVGRVQVRRWSRRNRENQLAIAGGN